MFIDNRIASNIPYGIQLNPPPTERNQKEGEKNVLLF